MIFDKYYRLGFEAGVNHQKLEADADQNRRLEDMLRRGKKIGHDEGWIEGYKKGYQVGYSEGELDTMERTCEIDLDKVLEEVKDEYTGFKGLVNDEGVVDDITEAKA